MHFDDTLTSRKSCQHVRQLELYQIAFIQITQRTREVVRCSGVRDNVGGEDDDRYAGYRFRLAGDANIFGSVSIACGDELTESSVKALPIGGNVEGDVLGVFVEAADEDKCAVSLMD